MKCVRPAYFTRAGNWPAVLNIFVFPELDHLVLKQIDFLNTSFKSAQHALSKSMVYKKRNSDRKRVKNNHLRLLAYCKLSM